MSSDTLITIIITLIIVPAAVIPYLRRHRKKEREARKRFEGAKIAGLQAAVTMHPHIDALECIGCGGCVDACPEHDVLGVINGKAVLINGSKCVGHGLCAEACPVGGITMMMAAPGKSADLPILNEHLETTVRGIYIAGELGGLGLIRNAVNQGIKAVSHIATLPRAQKGVYDVAIVGAGPAGLGAGLTALASKLNYLILDQGDVGGTILQYPRRKIVMTSPVELPLWGKLKLTEVSKESLLDVWLQILKKTGLKVSSNHKVTNIARDGNRFVLTTPTGSFNAAHVVLCLGRRGTPRKLGVEGESLSKVTYRLIDAESYQNVDVLVVGGGDSAVEAAMGLALQGSNRVTMSYRKGEFTRLKDRNVEHLQHYLKKKAITVIFNSQPTVIREKEVLLETREGLKVIPNDYVFVFAGGELPFEFLKSVGVGFQSKELN
jgi:thioredoxin reductase/NAD-dependent dihydropyrimidine dehydrogenase PreA subunit